MVEVFMYRVAFALMAACWLASLAPAQAADFSGRYVRPSSDCCRQQVAGYGPDVSYDPLSAFPYIVPRHPVYLPPERHRYVEAKAYDSYPNAAAARCHWHEAPVRIDRKLWVWGGKTTCY
jgi:hypothetical protein